MKEIKLTQGKAALIDDEDFERLNEFLWYVRKDKKRYYAVRAVWLEGKQKTIRMHHEILGDPPSGLETDHKDGSGLNNQKHNLRFVTHRQNCQNKKNVIKTSQYPGVSWYKNTEKWCSYININSRRKHLGSFMSEIDAFNVYKESVHSLGEKMIGEL